MFQVASRPTPPYFASAPDALNLSMASYQHSSGHKLNIPRHLARPNLSEPSRDTLAKIDPSLANVPFEYIKKMLAGQADRMLAAHSLLTIPSSLPGSHLPPTLDAPIRPTSNAPDASAFPTHVLAILSGRSSATTPTAASFADKSSMSAATTVPLYPASALVLAVHCTLLPSLPRGHPPSNRRAAISLPVIPLTVPSPEAFPLLHAYLHTMRPDTLLAALVPALASSLPQLSASSGSAGRQSAYVAQFSADRLLRLAHTLAGAAFARGGPQGAMGGLMAHVKVINGLWQNVCALGVFDPEMWGVLDLAWEIVLAAMTKVAESGNVRM